MRRHHNGSVPATIRVAFQFVVASILAGTLCFSTQGCGGSGAGSKGGSTVGLTLAPLTVSVKLPTGFSPPSGGLKLSGGKFDAIALTGTTAQVPSWTFSRQLVGVIDTNDNPILMGLIGPGHNVIDSHSTAVAAVFLYIAGFGVPDSEKENLIEVLEADSEVASLATQIEGDLLSSGNLSSDTAGYRSGVAAIAGHLAGQTRAHRKPNAVEIAPPLLTKSGVLLHYTDTENQVIAQNSWRRRVMVFVNEVLSVDSAGTGTTKNTEFTSFELAPAKGDTGNAYGFIGNFDPIVESSPVTLPALSPQESRTDYHVVSAGPGALTNSAELAKLTPAQRQALAKFLNKSFVKDFFLPTLNMMMANAAVPDGDHQEINDSYEVIERAVDSQEAAVLSFVSTNFPNAQVQMTNGDFGAALNDVVKGLGNKTTLQNFVNFYLLLLGNHPPLNNGNPIRMTQITNWIYHVIKTADFTTFVPPQYQDYSGSSQFDGFDLSVYGTKINLTPLTSDLSNSNPAKGSAVLTANVTVPGGLPIGSTLVYSWTTDASYGGFVGAGLNGGQILDSPSNTVTYQASNTFPAGGTDAITVEVKVKDQAGSLTPIGTAHATVTVHGTIHLKLLPMNLSVQPGQTSSTILADTSSTFASSGNIRIGILKGQAKLRWSISSGLGSLNTFQGILTTVDKVKFSAINATGTAVVTCEMVGNDDPTTVLATSSTAINIQNQQTFGVGLFKTGSSTFVENGITHGHCQSWMEAPIVAGCKTIQVLGYNFHDPGTNRTTFSGAAHLVNGKWVNDAGSLNLDAKLMETLPPGSGGVIQVLMSGGTGGVQDLGAQVAELQSRYQGIQVQITYGY